MKSFLTITFLIITLSSRAIGLGDWQKKTPCGNVMGDPGGGTILILTKNNQVINNISRWYFFRKHIVGQTSSDYFIVNETTGEVWRYNEVQEWNTAIKKSELSPTIWTRWFTDNWKFYERMLFTIIFIGAFILLPLLFFLFRRLNRWITSDDKPKFKKTQVAVFIGIALIIVARILLDIYPQSV